MTGAENMKMTTLPDLTKCFIMRILGIMKKTTVNQEMSRD